MAQAPLSTVSLLTVASQVMRSLKDVQGLKQPNHQIFSGEPKALTKRLYKNKQTSLYRHPLPDDQMQGLRISPADH